MSLKNLTDQIRQSTDFQRNKLRLREQMQTDLLVPYDSALFKASPELIAFLTSWDEDEVYLEDLYGNPVLCNRIILLTKCKEQHQRVLNRWHLQYEELQQIRKI